MTVHKIAKPRPLKTNIEKGVYDGDVSAVLYFLWKSGQLKAYPLDKAVYPDTEETAEKMTVAMLKLKLKCDCQKVPCFKDKLITKGV